MLRRDATVITIRESDVDELKEILAAQREQASESSNARGASVLGAQTYVPYVAVEEARKKREGMTREQRLGVE